MPSVGSIFGSLALFVAAQGAIAATTKINGVTYTGKGTATAPKVAKDGLAPEQSLRLKKVFLFPTVDDLSGALAPKLDEKLFDLFSHNTRFEVIRDPQVLKALSPDEGSYYKAAKVTGADTTVLLRTRNVGPDTRMTLELRDASGSLQFAEEGSIPGSSTMDVRWALIEKLYRAFLSRLPFEGTVTGRTAATITVDLGMGSMKQGEEFEIARIVSVQRHPLLGTVICTDYVRTGRARAATVDRVLTFADVIEEFPGEKIGPGQKILRAQSSVVHRGGLEAESEKRPPLRNRERNSEFDPVKREDKQEENPLEDRLKSDLDRPKARYGQMGGNLYYGSLSHSQTVNSTATDYSGSGIGGGLDGELWVTKNWILMADYGFQSATLSSVSAPVGSVSWNTYG